MYLLQTIPQYSRIIRRNLFASSILPNQRTFISTSSILYSSPSIATPATSPSSSLICYINNQYVPIQDAKISVEDRGFLFSDGIYEVTKVYSAKSLGISKPYIFTEKEHLQRMINGLEELQFTKEHIDYILTTVKTVSRELLQRNKLGIDNDAIIYIQITRGISSPRMHAYPNPTIVPPTIFISAKPFINPTKEILNTGVSAVTQLDTRWSRCNIKSIALLSNVIANQYAKLSHAYECLLLRKYQNFYAIVEASHSNVFAVYKKVSKKTVSNSSSSVSSSPKKSTSTTTTTTVSNPYNDYLLITHPLNKNILPGITRFVILQNAKKLGITVKEGLIRYADKDLIPIDNEKYKLQELFVTATTTEIMPIIKIDQTYTVGNGKVGPITQALRNNWLQWVKDEYNTNNKKE